jgi:hypothetical protein
MIELKTNVDAKNEAILSDCQEIQQVLPHPISL